MDFAYVALLKVISESTFAKLMAKDRSCFSLEAKRLESAQTLRNTSYASNMFLVLTYLADQIVFANAFANQGARPLTEHEQAVQLVIQAGSSRNRHDWLFEAANLLNESLIRLKR